MSDLEDLEKTIETLPLDVLKAILSNGIGEITFLPHVLDHISLPKGAIAASFKNSKNNRYLGTVVYDPEAPFFSCYDALGNCQHFDVQDGIIVRESGIVRKFQYLKLEDSHNFLTILDAIYNRPNSFRSTEFESKEAVAEYLRGTEFTGKIPGMSGEFFKGKQIDYSKNIVFGRHLPDDTVDLLSSFRRVHKDAELFVSRSLHEILERRNENTVCFDSSKNLIVFRTKKYELIYDIKNGKYYYFSLEFDSKMIDFIAEYGVKIQPIDATGKTGYLLDLYITPEETSVSKQRKAKTKLTIPDLDQRRVLAGDAVAKNEKKIKEIEEQLRNLQVKADEFNTFVRKDGTVIKVKNLEPQHINVNFEVNAKIDPVQLGEELLKGTSSYLDPKGSAFKESAKTESSNLCMSGSHSIGYRLYATTSSTAVSYTINSGSLTYASTNFNDPSYTYPLWVCSSVPQTVGLLHPEPARVEPAKVSLQETLKGDAKEAFFRTATKKAKQELAKILAGIVAKGQKGLRNPVKLKTLETFLLSDAGSALLGAFLAMISPSLEPHLPDNVKPIAEKIAKECRVSGIAWLEEEVLDSVVSAIGKVDLSSMLFNSDEIRVEALEEQPYSESPQEEEEVVELSSGGLASATF